MKYMKKGKYMKEILEIVQNLIPFLILCFGILIYKKQKKINKKFEYDRNKLEAYLDFVKANDKTEKIDFEYIHSLSKILLFGKRSTLEQLAKLNKEDCKFNKAYFYSNNKNYYSTTQGIEQYIKLLILMLNEKNFNKKEHLNKNSQEDLQIARWVLQYFFKTDQKFIEKDTKEKKTDISYTFFSKN